MNQDWDASVSLASGDLGSRGSLAWASLDLDWGVLVPNGVPSQHGGVSASTTQSCSPIQGGAPNQDGVLPPDGVRNLDEDESGSMSPGCAPSQNGSTSWLAKSSYAPNQNGSATLLTAPGGGPSLDGVLHRRGEASASHGVQSLCGVPSRHGKAPGDDPSQAGDPDLDSGVWGNTVPDGIPSLGRGLWAQPTSPCRTLSSTRTSDPFPWLHSI